MTERAIGVTDEASGAGVADYRLRERSVPTADPVVLIGAKAEGETADFIASGTGAGWHFVAAQSGSIKRIWTQTKVANPTLTAMQMGVYSDAAGVPGTRLAFANVDSLAAAQGAMPFCATLATPLAVTAGTTYHLCVAPTGEQYDWMGTAAAGAYSEDAALAGVLPATWTQSNVGGNRVAIWADSDPTTITVDEQYVIKTPERVLSGVYAANTGRHSLNVAAQGATTGFWYFINPVGATSLVALRHMYLAHGFTASGITLATSPRVTLERFTFTGTASGTAITPVKRKGTDAAATAKLVTASTGLTITAGALASAWLPVFAFTGTVDCAKSNQFQALYRRDFSQGAKQWATAVDAGTPVLEAGEGLIFRQTDAGSTSEATHRTFSCDLLWEEYTLP